MPRELLAIAPRTPVLREYTEPPLGPAQVRIRAEFASPKHGSSLVTYRGTPGALSLKYDREWGCLLPTDEADAPPFPRRLGNMAAGVVTEVGAAVSRFRPGDRVFGHLPIRETYTVHESRIDPLPEGLTPEGAVCLDPAVMALAIRDAGIKLGDRVAVFGLGAIGLLAVQLARLAGASQVIAVDPLAPRRELAQRYGADQAIAPGDDGGLAVRRLAVRRLTEPVGEHPPPEALPAPEAEAAPTLADELERLGQPRRVGRHVLGGYAGRETQWGNLGADVSIEASGNTHALQDAIRSTRFGGTVCVLSYYPGEAAGLRLGEEFHLNQLQLLSCRSESLPMRDAPGWTLDRMAGTALRWLATGRLRTDGLVTPVLPFEQSPDAYRLMDEHPEQCIKVGIRFDASS